MATRALDPFRGQDGLGWWGWVRQQVLEAESEEHEPTELRPAGAHGCVQHLTWQLVLVLLASAAVWVGVGWLLLRVVLGR